MTGRRRPDHDHPVRVLGLRLDQARRRRGWTYREFEQHTGVSKSTLQYLVRRRTSPPDYYQLKSLVDRLGERWDGEWELLWRRAVDRTPQGPAEAPAQLPVDVAQFTGRTAELALLDRMLLGASSAATPIGVVAGTAGVGKTALAIRWAHRVRAAFPDGQLYVDLRGYEIGRPLAAGTALVGFLRALGAGPQDIPYELAERAAALRTLLDGRRVLLVLDNAASAEHVRPLLPGSPSCLVLVTSRDSLAGLVARHGAHRLTLDPLPVDDAVGLLGVLVGDRARAEPGATAALAEQCARLPLALRVAAEYASSRPSSRLAQLVAELDDRHRRLDLLDAGGDPRTAVRAVLSWSYDHLPVDAARLFRLLGSQPARDLGPAAAAALAGTGVAHAQRMLDALVRAHLVETCGADRYRMHDLLRAYAADRSRAEDAEPARRTALAALLDHYLATASAAARALYPADGTPAQAPATGGPLDAAAALAWLRAEQSTLVTVCGYAAQHGPPDRAVRLATVLAPYLVAGHFTDAVTVHGHAADAARRGGDRAGEATAMNNLGTVYQRQSRHRLAVDHLEAALARYRDVGDEEGALTAANELAGVHFRLGHYQAAADHLRQALRTCVGGKHRYGEARARANLGTVLKRQGQCPEAVEHFERALELFRALGRRDAEVVTLDHLGHVHGKMGAYRRAIGYHRESLALCRQLGDRYGEADALDNLGQIHRRMGRYQEAAENRRRALELYRDIGIPSGEAEALNGLGETLLACSRAADALASHRTALRVATAFDDPYEQARAHQGIAECHHSTGDRAASFRHWRLALELYTRIEVPEAGEVLARLGGAAG